MSLDTYAAETSRGFGYQTFSSTPELTPVREFLPTGVRAADELLDGGLLVGATHCISGEPTSGASEVCYIGRLRARRRKACPSSIWIWRSRLNSPRRPRPGLISIACCCRADLR